MNNIQVYPLHGHQKLLAIFIDASIIPLSLDQRVYVRKEGVIQNKNAWLLVIIPLFRTDSEMRINIEETKGMRRSFQVPWHVGYMVLIPQEVNIKILGPVSDHLGFLGIGYGSMEV